MSSKKGDIRQVCESGMKYRSKSESEMMRVGYDEVGG